MMTGRWKTTAGAFALLTMVACGGEEPIEQDADTSAEAAAPEAMAETTAMDPETVVAGEADADWEAFVDSMIEEYFVFAPTFAIDAGRHEFDGQLPDWSEDGLLAMTDFLRGAMERAEAFDPAALTDDLRFQRDYVMDTLDGQLFWLETYDMPTRNPGFYLGPLDPAAYITREYADAATRLEAFIAYAEKVPAAAEQIEANLALPLPSSFVKLAEAGFGGLADFYIGNARDAFASVEDEDLQARLVEATEAASAAMAALAEHVVSVEPVDEGYALGPDGFAEMLRRTEGVTTPLDELKAIGEADLARNKEILAKACADYAPDLDLPGCMQRMNAQKPEAGPVQAARDQLPMLKAFLQAEDIVSIPGTEEAQVEESPPYRRQNLAYISIPGPFEPGIPSVYYIAPPDPEWDEATRNGYIPGKANLLAISVHEVWPGHFLNFLHAKTSDTLFGRLFVGYAFAEGWAHYTEEMMVDAGLGADDPEVRIGQISNALLRNCRYLSAIGLHSGEMTVEESRDLFLNECFQDAGNATQQAARGTYDPAYLNYTMGKLMIRKLRDDWVSATMPEAEGTEGWKAFHDEFLGYGGPQIPLVRAAMMGEDEPRSVFD